MHNNLPTLLINFDDADHACDLTNCRSTIVTLNFLNKFLPAWFIGKQLKLALNFTVTELNAIATGAKLTHLYRSIVINVGIPLNSATLTGEDNFDTLNLILKNKLSCNICHEAVKIYFLPNL